MPSRLTLISAKISKGSCSQLCSETSTAKPLAATNVEKRETKEAKLVQSDTAASIQGDSGSLINSGFYDHYSHKLPHGYVDSSIGIDAVSRL